MKEQPKSQNEFHVTIREAKGTDAAAIARIDVDAGHTTYTGIMLQEYLDSRTYEQRTMVWLSRYSNANKLWNGWFIYVAANNEGEVIGFAGGGPQHGDIQGYSGELAFIYLLKSFQRHGIGRQLIGVIVKRLKQQGHNSMLVWVFAQNLHRSFYEALGRQTIGEKEANYGGKNIKEIAYGWQDLGVFENMVKPASKF